MTTKNPTVPLEVTAKELRVLARLLGYDAGCITLRGKLSEADKRMRIATRDRNRAVKQARMAKRKETP